MHCQGQHKWLAQLVGLVVRQQLVKLFFLSRSGEQATAGQQDKMQLLREEKLAANLKALLRRWVEGDQTGFRVGPTACAVLGCAVLCCAVLGWAGPYCGTSMLFRAVSFYTGKTCKAEHQLHSAAHILHQLQLGHASSALTVHLVPWTAVWFC